MTKNLIIPSDPAQLAKIKSMAREGTDSLLRIDAEKELLKDITAKISEDFEIPKAYVSKLIKHMHAADFDKKATEFDDFTEFFSAVQKA